MVVAFFRAHPKRRNLLLDVLVLSTLPYYSIEKKYNPSNIKQTWFLSKMAAPASSIVPPSQEILDFYRHKLDHKDTELHELYDRYKSNRTIE